MKDNEQYSKLEYFTPMFCDKVLLRSIQRMLLQEASIYYFIIQLRDAPCNNHVAWFILR